MIGAVHSHGGFIVYITMPHYSRLNLVVLY